MQGKSTAELINKMKTSIQHQAETTVREIKRQAEQDADRLRVHTVYQERTKIVDASRLERKRIISQKSVSLSTETGKQRMKLLNMRNDAVESAMDLSKKDLAEFVAKPEYKALLRDLCVQGLLSLMENEVAIAVTARDQDVAKSMVGEITKEYTARTKKDAKITISDYVLPDAAIGGCVLIAKEGKIQCSNTLMDRLVLACKDLYPRIREILFREK